MLPLPTVAITARPPTVVPSVVAATTGSQRGFTAYLAGVNAPTWSVNGVIGGDATLGTVNSTGRYTAPALVPVPATVTLRAEDPANSAVFATASITISQPVVITVALTPASLSLRESQHMLMTGVVSGSPDQRLTWSVNGIVGGNATVGTIVAPNNGSAGMIYTAPESVPSPITVTIQAVSLVDPTAIGTAPVALSSLGRLAVLGLSAQVNGLAINSLTGRAYVSDPTGVRVVDLATNTLGPFITVPYGTTTVCLDETADRVFAVGGTQVVIIDGATNTLVGAPIPVISTGYAALHCEYSPADDTVLLNLPFQPNAGIVVVDLATRGERTRLASFNATTFAINRQTNQLIVGAYTSTSFANPAQILIYDLATYAQVGSFNNGVTTLFQALNGMAVDPFTNTALVASGDDAHAWFLDLGPRTVDNSAMLPARTIGLGSPVTLDLIHNRGLIADTGIDTLRLIDMSTRSQSAGLPIPGNVGTSSVVYDPVRNTAVLLSFSTFTNTYRLSVLPLPTVAITARPQSITFGPLTNSVYGDVPFTLTAAASSSLPVSFDAGTSDACTVLGSRVTITHAGSCTITATQGGNASFQPAAPVSRTFTVAKATQTVTFAALSAKLLGAPPFTVDARADSDLTVAFTVGPTDACTIAGSVVTMTTAGTCTVTAHQDGNSDFEAAPPVSRTFAIADTEAPRIIAPANVTVSNDPGACSATGLALGSASVTDNDRVASVTNDAPARFTKGTTVVTWTANDPSGNSASATQTVTVEDTQRPTIAAPSGRTLVLDAASGTVVSTAALGSPTVADNCPNSEVSVTGIPAGNLFPLGTTTLTWTAQDGSGNRATATQLVTIEKRPVTIKARGVSSVYGSTTTFALEVATGSLLPGDGLVALGTPIFTTTPAPALNAGHYTIAVGGLSNPFYAISYEQTGTLDIAPARLTITAYDKSRVHGAPNPAFDATYDGLVRGESPAVLSGALTCATGATQGSGAGAYAIICNGVSSTNYAITYVAGTLTIGRASTTTIATNASGIYGGGSLVVTATVRAQAPSTATVSEGAVAFTLTIGSSVVTGSGLVSGGTATAVLSLPAGLRVGTYSLVASYGGSTNFLPSTSPQATFSNSCPTTLTLPMAIVTHQGKTLRGTVVGTEQTQGGLCAVSYRLVASGITFGTGSFMADHSAPGVIVISNGTFAILGYVLPLSFAGTFDLNAGTARIRFTYASALPSRTVNITFLRAGADYVITSATITSP